MLINYWLNDSLEQQLLALDCIVGTWWEMDMISSNVDPIDFDRHLRKTNYKKDNV